eukprot:1622325-Pleurochrysis_carterae.AAC.2
MSSLLSDIDMSAGDAASGEFAASASNSCYSSYLGSCNDCNVQGSCNCGSSANGLSDFVLMDRERWGDQILLCTQNEPALYVGFIIGAVCALESIRRSILAIKIHQALADRHKRRYIDHEPLLTLCWGVVSMAGIICLSVIKLSAPQYVIGIDMLPSFVLAFRLFAFHAGIEVYLFYVLSVASRTQQASYGRQHLQDAARRRWRKRKRRIAHLIDRCTPTCVGVGGRLLALSLGVQVSVFFVTSNIPLVYAVLATVGYSASMHVQLPLAVSYYAIEAVRLSFNASVMFIDMRRLERSFAASVEAAKVSVRA